MDREEADASLELLHKCWEVPAIAHWVKKELVPFFSRFLEAHNALLLGFKVWLFQKPLHMKQFIPELLEVVFILFLSLVRRLTFKFFQ